MPKLIFFPGSGAPSAHELAEELISIGRSPENLIQLDDPSVSGKHAELRQVGETFHLRDLNSTNGTRVNGEATTSVALRVGDRIRFGKVDACFECEEVSNAPLPPVLTEVEAKPAEVSARPADFTNASPFPRRRMQRDFLRTAILAAVGVAILAFLGSMIALLQMQTPAP